MEITQTIKSAALVCRYSRCIGPQPSEHLTSTKRRGLGNLRRFLNYFYYQAGSSESLLSSVISAAFLLDRRFLGQNLLFQSSFDLPIRILDPLLQYLYCSCYDHRHKIIYFLVRTFEPRIQIIQSFKGAHYISFSFYTSSKLLAWYTAQNGV